MSDSEYLRDLKTVWGISCHSMWAELLSISITENLVRSRYAKIESSACLDEIVYAPEVKGRLGHLTKDRYLERVPNYKDAVITNRVIILSASFELYLNNFVDAYLAARQQFYDQATGKRTAAGDKIYGEVMKVRGLSARIKKMAEMMPFKIKSLNAGLDYVDDVYMLRNVLAHRAGQVDDCAAQNIKHISFRSGDRVVITAEQMMALAAPVIKVAEGLDRKLT
ncbi:hypothetical protein HLH33_00500 [Gluconacetobacter diazotrophicus]|uniref:RiboL-PSP-HEPN domain-containing protein n=1 Tax=Gluconacetobacter diazotrophicus TaxID=33996 RepID=A0A7W4FBP6_GLUDI|nr:hypothetical protein [Gluconacetobacter diazotrophicus]MBB2154800.1 hypothetical protein [Gluconacetobacter diazotrophicus]